jgi:hypothetical protein
MTEAIVLGITILAVVVVAATFLKRRAPEPPTQPKWHVPAQLDRADFVRPDAAWLVVTFTSETCQTCAGVAEKVRILDSPVVAAQVASFQDARTLHDRYTIDAVPTTLVADAQGVVVAHFTGPVSATDLWAAVAEAREPGSTPPPEAHTHG